MLGLKSIHISKWGHWWQANNLPSGFSKRLPVPYWVSGIPTCHVSSHCIVIFTEPNDYKAVAVTIFHFFVCLFKLKHASSELDCRLQTLANISWPFTSLLMPYASGVNCPLISVIDGWDKSFEIALTWILLELTDKPILVQVMAWWHQAISHYLSQCWPRSMSV